MTLNVT